jgi:hypothetical protein
VNVVLLPVHRELRASSRAAALTRPEDRLRWAELGILWGAGVTAAIAVGSLDFHLRLPGHAILRAVFPMALGLSLVPRHGGGGVMGAGAATTILCLQVAGRAVPGVGALTSLCLIGPVLDGALWRARSGWPVYVSFAVAGGLTNLAAFAVRGGKKLTAWEALTTRPLADWVSTAAWSYLLCGLLAGLLSAAIWFRWHADRADQRSAGSAS